MDFTTLVAGPAQAGSHTPLSKPGIGLAAGAGTSPAADGAGDASFASLVALALGQSDGTAEGQGTAGDQARDASGDGGAGIDGEADDATDTASTPDAPVDAVALSVLIALATPAPVAPVAPVTQGPDVAGQGSAEVAIAGSSTAPGSVTVAVDVTSPESLLAAGGPTFQDAGPTANTVQTTTATPAGADESVHAAPTIAGAAPAVVPAAAPAADDASATDHASVAGRAAVNGAVPAAPAASSDAAVPAPASPVSPAVAAAVVPGSAPAATAASASPRGAARPAADPLREALAAMAGQASVPASEPASASVPAAVAGQAGAAGTAPALASGGGVSAHGTIEARGNSAAHAEMAAAGMSAPASAATDAQSSGDRPSEGAGDGSGASAFSRPADLRVDGPVAAGIPPSMPAGAPDVVAAGASAPTAGLTATGLAPLAAVDLPSAARFEQALASLDPDARNLQAMVRTVRLFTAGTGASEARLVLEPEHLGPVALTVRVEQGTVSAHFRAETPAAHRWIETHQQELRSGLREQGLEVKELVVTTDPDGRRDRREAAQPARPPRARRSPSADTPRFEVVV